MPDAPRFFCPTPLLPGTTVKLGAGAARHVQVLRLQPGDRITLFGGAAHRVQSATDSPARNLGYGEFEATIAEMGRRDVLVLVGRHHAPEREPARELHLAIGMPANERMDWLVEKATELGVAVIQPLMTERSVLRLDDERARKKTAHWESIAIAACEQCGRNRVPVIRKAAALPEWTRQWVGMRNDAATRLVLSLRPCARPLRQVISEQLAPAGQIIVLSGPEGGLSACEEDLAMRQSFEPVSLGPRVLRSETAALVALTLLT